MSIVQCFDPRKADLRIVLGTGFGVNLLAFAGVGIALVNPDQGDQNWSHFATQSGDPPTDFSKVLQAMDEAQKAKPWEVALMEIKPELPKSTVEFANKGSKVVEAAKPAVKITVKAQKPVVPTATKAEPSAITKATKPVSYPPKQPAKPAIKPTLRPNISPPEVIREPVFAPTPKPVKVPKVDSVPTPVATPKQPELVTPTPVLLPSTPAPAPRPEVTPLATQPEVVQPEPQPTPRVETPPVTPQVTPTPLVTPTP
jgi:hypothetical protein